jgi:hypothetical protein
MRLALLGGDDTVLGLARAAMADGHRVTCLCDTGAALIPLREIAPLARVTTGWESLVEGGGGESGPTYAVLVAGADSGEERLEQLRRLTQDGVALLVAHPFDLAMLGYYELDMIRRDVGGLLLPCLPWRNHPAVDRLRDLMGEAAPLGRLEQATLERRTPLRDRLGVLGHFARDVDLLRAVCGELNKVAGQAPTDEAARFANLSVQLTGPGDVQARWSVEPAKEVSARLTLRCTRGKGVLTIPPADEPWRLDLEAVESAPRSAATGNFLGESFPIWNAAQAAIGDLERGLAGQPVRPNWLDAARSVELTEAVERSLARGRTIELYDEEVSEQATFKGIMSAAGCLLLLLGLVSLVIAAVAAKLGVAWAGYWLYVLCGLFGLFLLLQLFKLVFPPDGHPGSKD